MHVIGTAGHVDHGKSTLIEALTNTHPDRLSEERERGMSIVIGFAWLELPTGEEIGIVDVPGHRDFIENMLSGIGGIDAALFVVAADEGVMPQTKEHLAILDLLEIPGGVVALTKTDLIDDPDWLDLVELDLRETLENTVLEDAPIVRVSGKTGEGLEELQHALGNTLSARPQRPNLGRPRLSVDRAFTVSGFGTVITGTLLDGELRVGDKVVILPSEQEGRVRGLQTHKRKEDVAIPGSRTAVNISGVDVGQIQRGDVIAHPGDYAPTRRLDVRFRLLPDVAKPLTHNIKAKLFLGADEVMARIRLLGADVLSPGEEGWLQLEVPEPVVALRGDHYILRRPSPSETLGGGVVLDPKPKYRHKRFNKDVLARLEALAGGNPIDILQQIIRGAGAGQWSDILVLSSLEETIAAQSLTKLLQKGVAVAIGPENAPNKLVAYAPYWQNLKKELIAKVETYHRTYPLRFGIPREELKSQSRLSGSVFEIALRTLIREEHLLQKGPVIAFPAHKISFTPDQQAQVDALLKKFQAALYQPPTIKECHQTVGEEIYNALVGLEELIPISAEVVFSRSAYEQMVAETKNWLRNNETISVSQVRDLFDSSRRYALAFLEHLDSKGITVRVGDVRYLKITA
ncbi:MAG: selenocysteine-specific translation elongation factor [Anaerolineaceae bacterium 4572_5.2]|nr:MAG: selenocysteine-specific translation elongation factor [Anaerolineaceae bacterium 4572_5.2]